MFWPFATFYLIAGIITAAVTIRVFPPMEGFRPRLSLLLLAITVFVLFWPVLVLLAMWYHFTAFLQRSRRRKAKIKTNAPIAISVSPSVRVPKPR